MNRASRTLLSASLSLLAISAVPAQTLLGRLVPKEPSFHDFGASVALAGTVAVVGEPAGGPKGRIHAFDVVTGKRIWKLGKELPPYVHDFGSALAADGGRVIAVSHHHAWILDARTGTIQSLLRQPIGSGFALASAVGLAGDHAVISVEGQAFVFDVPTAALRHTLVSPLPPEDSRFGYSLALDGARVVVGAPATTLDGAEATYVYDALSGQLTATLVRDGGVGGGQFGRAVAVRGDRILVGAPIAGDAGFPSGAAYLFDAQGNQLARFVDPQVERNARFGTSVHLGERLAVVGARGANDGAGKVHVFDVESGEWLWSLAPIDRPFANEGLGTALDVDCGRVLAAAPGDEFWGAAYLFTLQDREVGRSFCGPANANSTGTPAELTAIGSADVRCNLVRLVASGLPPGRVGVFIVSRTQDFVPFVNGSQGNLCLGGVVGRFEEVGAADGSGRLELGLDLRAIPQSTGQVTITPRDTWSFQAWYRDVNPGATSNLTDARAVTFAGE